MNHNSSKQLQQRLAIAIATDAAYAEQVVTLIKSICYHHRHVHFYILNKNFPLRLGELLQTHLSDLDCQITNILIKVDFSDYKMAEHINETSFYRFIVPDITEDRVLYLDADTIVDGHLGEFYQLDFEDHLAVAIPDMVVNRPEIEHHYMEFPEMKPYFNAGVLLINNPAWREQHILDKAIHLFQTCKGLIYADQDILNILLHRQWKQGDLRYNFQTGARWGLYPRGFMTQSDQQEQSCPHPVIIHYTGANKAWLNHQPILHADRYWFYYRLTWQEIKHRWA